MAIRIDFESSGVFCPDASDIFVGCEATEGLEPASMVVGVDEQLEMLPEFVMAAVVIAFDGSVLDGPVPRSAGRNFAWCTTYQT